MITFPLVHVRLVSVAVVQLVQFMKINISQGRVATRFECGDIFSVSFIANCT